MIEVHITETGDRAEANTAEAAILAARTMANDHYDSTGGIMSRYTVRFFVEGVLVAECGTHELATFKLKEIA